MNRIVLTAILLTLFTLTVTAQPNGCAPAAGEPVRIGAVFPAGNLFSAEAGAPWQGVQAMVEAVNVCGGVNSHPVELAYTPAADRGDAAAALEALRGVPLIIGSGTSAVSDALVQASARGDFVYWEVSESLDAPHEWAFSPRPSNYQIGQMTGDYVDTIPTLNGASPRVALISENRPRAQAIVKGILEALDSPPLIEWSYENNLTDSRRLALNIREQGITVVIMAAFENDADQLWYAMRQADANVKAWIQVGGDSYRRNTCERFGNTDGLISISAAGQVSEAYRLETAGAVYEQYKTIYQAEFGDEPGERADLAASGAYLLMRGVLPQVERWSAEGIRAAILAADLPAPAGLMGEGLEFTSPADFNKQATILVQQRQENRFCTVWPEAAATCEQGLIDFRTWRERAIAAEQAECVDW